VSQDIFLFNETIENNIKYGCTGASRAEVVMAAKKAHSHDFILKFPHGYDTVVGEKGYKLSAGQRQRVSLARALLKDAPILILDEPTSALDQATESLVTDTIREACADKTVIVISHKPANRGAEFDVVNLSSLSYSGTSSSSRVEG
jgi:ABC-type multidrug transport system fused ATPase/permease subunit